MSPIRFSNMLFHTNIFCKGMMHLYVIYMYHTLAKNKTIIINSKMYKIIMCHSRQGIIIRREEKAHPPIAHPQTYVSTHGILY